MLMKSLSGKCVEIIVDVLGATASLKKWNV